MDQDESIVSDQATSEGTFSPSATSVVVGYESPCPIPPSPVRGVHLFYSRALAEKISDLYLEGLSLVSISKMEGMPSYGTITGWAKHKEEFRKMLDGAREFRATHFEEMAIEEAMSATHKEEVPSARLHFDAMIWAASVNNPERYGKKTVLSGDSKRPVTFQIVTGVPQQTTHEEIEVAAKDAQAITEVVLAGEEEEDGATPA